MHSTASSPWSHRRSPGSILVGFVTATEAGVLACLYSIVLGLIYRTLTFGKFWAALSDTHEHDHRDHDHHRLFHRHGLAAGISRFRRRWVTRSLPSPTTVTSSCCC
ncbi:MAG: hypothetical protein R3D03_11245 [Geminicoccaceae bacterium]